MAMNRWLVVYSSVTGNTKKVAEAFCEAVNG
ncbi:MAG: flavodoxin, partial [Schwartzia sp.]|nr:flavodoxin [Schwartzia sp. (in: firmicutes)]